MTSNAYPRWTRRSLLSLAIAGVSASLVPAHSVVAQDGAYPRAKAIRWIVPNAPGSPLDINARRIAEIVARKLGATIVVENRVGAGGVIAANEVARAAPDGYTFLISLADPLIAGTALVKDIPYDPVRNFTFITKIINGRAPLAIRSELKIETLPQLIEAAKTRSFTYASMGPGTFPQMIVEELNRVAGVKIAEIAYKTSVQGYQAFLTGEVDLNNLGPAQALELSKQGKVNLLGVTGRSPLFPNLPSFTEAGFDTTILKTPLWFGILGPANLPPKIVDMTLAALRGAFEEEELKAFFRASGSEVVLKGPAEFEKEFAVETAAVIPLIKALGIIPQ